MVNYDPINIIYHWLFQSNRDDHEQILLKIIGSQFLALVIISNSSVVLYFMAISLAFAETMCCTSSKLATPYKSSSFWKCLRRYWIITIMLQAGCQVAEKLFKLLLMMVIAAAVASLCTAMKLYRQLPLLINLPISCIFPFMLCLMFVLFTLAAIPAENVENFMRFWRRKVTNTVAKRWMRSYDRLEYLSDS